ncbi:conserved hypothetical protein [Crenothrix polyspora]|uniref:Uncharacterized protein n=1 Tax=Crenothrix polyspora TaxID=360316 RepID=A0A1R4H1U9_9GAMM|nr:hypothetical protein [Crenothrix polyspora]SJM90203.1 conserved hypothetical protein [Crenothrix polyspora]
MSFKPMDLDDKLIGKLDAFLETNSFVDLYSTYDWEEDTRENGFPDIFCLESRLNYSNQTTGITLSDVKSVAKWGLSRHQNRIEGIEIVLPAHSLQCKLGLPNQKLEGDPSIPLHILQKSITKGVGPTYLSKILRFGLPQEYGAIDTQCVRIFGLGDSGQHQWLVMSAKNDGYGWYIPKTQKAWPSAYSKWINILRYFASKLENNCPHPQRFVDAGLRKKGIWVCADVEMALFSYASQQLKPRLNK